MQILKIDRSISHPLALAIKRPSYVARPLTAIGARLPSRHGGIRQKEGWHNVKVQA